MIITVLFYAMVGTLIASTLILSLVLWDMFTSLRGSQDYAADLRERYIQVCLEVSELRHAFYQEKYGEDRGDELFLKEVVERQQAESRRLQNILSKGYQEWMRKMKGESDE